MYAQHANPSKQEVQPSSVAGEQQFSRDQYREFAQRLDSAMCSGGGGGDGGKTKEPFEYRRYEVIYNEARVFVEENATEILESAAARSGANLSAIAAQINDFNPILAAELLLAVDTAPRVTPLASTRFLESVTQLDPLIGSSLLYEARLTGNTTALTDARIFSNHNPSFFNALGTEAASEWFGSIGITGNLRALTSEAATSNRVLDFLGRDAKLASEFSYALGQTGKTGKLTDQSFLDALGSLDRDAAATYLSVMWCMRRVDEFATPDSVSRLTSGRDVWREAAREAAEQTHPTQGEKVVIAQVGGQEHNRGALLAAQSLFDAGFNVIYAGDVKHHNEVVRVALSEGARAIGFSIMDEAQSQIIVNTALQMKMDGHNVALFGGGIISEQGSTRLQEKGVRLFTQGSKPTDVISFISSHAGHTFLPRLETHQIPRVTFGSTAVEQAMVGGTAGYIRAVPVSLQELHWQPTARALLPSIENASGAALAYSFVFPPEEKRPVQERGRFASDEDELDAQGLKARETRISRLRQIIERAAEEIQNFNEEARAVRTARILDESKTVASRLETMLKGFGIANIADITTPRQPNHYELLGVRKSSSPQEIREAYQRAAKAHHPDVSGELDTGRMADINQAYAVLKNKKSRTAYDKALAERKGVALLPEEAESRISAQLLIGYSKSRDADFKAFMQRMSSPLTREEILAAIGEVGDWRARLDKTTEKMFREFRDAGKRVERLQAENRRLLKKVEDAAQRKKLRDNQKALEDLAKAYLSVNKGLIAIINRARREIRVVETRMVTALYASV